MLRQRFRAIVLMRVELRGRSGNDQHRIPCHLDELIETAMRIKQPFGGSLVHRYLCADD